MVTSDKGIDLITSFEGLVLSAYYDVARVPTIGYGHTSGVNIGDTCTKEQAYLWLKEDLKSSESKVSKYSGYNWNQNEFDALVSFAFNIGNIDQLTANGTRTREVIANKMIEYVNAGVHKNVEGLVRRRQTERALFLSGTYDEFPLATNGLERVSEVQEWLSSVYYKLTIDDIAGNETKKALVTALQFQLNAQFNKGIAIDGIFGSKTKAACVNVRMGATGEITKVLQALLKCYYDESLLVDGIFGLATNWCVCSYQDHNILAPDGVAGKETFERLCK